MGSSLKWLPMPWTWSSGMTLNVWRRSGQILQICTFFGIYKWFFFFFVLCLHLLFDPCRNHRGLRHYWGLRVRGQHTKTTGRRGKTVGVSKKRWESSVSVIIMYFLAYHIYIIWDWYCWGFEFLMLL